jgi:hypothetical protein
LGVPLQIVDIDCFALKIGAYNLSFQQIIQEFGGFALLELKVYCLHLQHVQQWIIQQVGGVCQYWAVILLLLKKTQF